MYAKISYKESYIATEDDNIKIPLYRIRNSLHLMVNIRKHKEMGKRRKRYGAYSPTASDAPQLLLSQGQKL